MKFGLTDAQYDFIYKTAVEPLEKQGAVVWCFGSRARGNFTAFSDLDLMVESDKDLGREISKVSEVLSNSNFPFKVDIVELRNFATGYLSSFQKERLKY